MKRCLFYLTGIFLLAVSLNAQQNPPAQKPPNTTAVKENLERQGQAKTKERRGVIKGRVVRDDGQPTAHIGVNLYPSGQRGNNRSIGTDEEGNFEADDLLPGSYIVSTFLPGFTRRPEPGEPAYYRIGDTVTLTLVKGGVITGTVRTAAGDPVINVGVRTLRVRDAEGKLIRRTTAGQDRRTDDRGVYRIYGLEAGAYVVLAGGSSSGFVVGYNRYEEDVATYYPSATRDTAVEVMVQSGQEASGIDILYRGEKGHAISGTVSGLAPEFSYSSISIRLKQAATGVMEAGIPIPPPESKKAFSLTGIADGDYLIYADSGGWPDPRRYFAAPARRLTVKGADVTGVELTLAPMASVSGHFVLEPTAATDPKTKCEPSREAVIEETLVSLRRDSKNEAPEQRWASSGAQGAVNDKGEFTLYGLAAGTYRPAVVLPNDTWYLKSATLSDAAKGNHPNLRSSQSSDVTGKGIALKAGEQLASVVITLAEGAASVSGAVKAAKEKEALPPRLRLYLVPAEKESAGEVLRYYETGAQLDGTFSFVNLAPGKYWLLSKPVSDDEMKDSAGPPYWYSEGRALLRKEAEAANNPVALQPCRKLTDFSLRHGVMEVAVTPALKK